MQPDLHTIETELSPSRAPSHPLLTRGFERTDRFFSERVGSDAEERRRAQLVFYVSIAIALLTCGLGLARVFLVHDVAQEWALFLSALAFASIPVVFAVTGSVNWSAFLLPLAGLLGIAAMGVVEGGLYSEAMFWIGFVPLVCAFVSPRRGTLFFMFGALLVATVLFALHLNGQLPVETPRGALTLRFSSLVAVILFSGALGWTYERTRQNAQSHLWKRANFHPLTGLANRHHFQVVLDRAVARAHRNGECLGLLFIDLDKLKTTNDRYGHRRGDQLLIAAGRRIEAAVRSSDFACHLSGDEFTVILEPCRSLDEANSAAERVRGALAEELEVGELKLPSSASVGVAILQASEGSNELFARADAAMYAAKKTGNRVAVG